jgi:adenylylsulfate kinase
LDKGVVIWLTGLPGSGKTTIANALKPILEKEGLRVELLDGDVVRRQLSPELGFTKQDREIHARRVVYLAKVFARNGVVAIVSLISPYREFRAYARKEIENFVEVYVKAGLQTCIKRDPKGLYAKALAGEIKDLTGLQDPYEEPLNPELIVDTDEHDLTKSVAMIIDKLTAMGVYRAKTSDEVVIQAIISRLMAFGYDLDEPQIKEITNIVSTRTLEK